MELFELEGTFKGHLVQLPCSEQGHPQLHQCSEPIQPDLGHLRGWGTTTSLGRMLGEMGVGNAKKKIG